MVEGLHHISLIASSEKTIEFYADLGFQEVRRIPRAGDAVVFMEGKGLALTIFVDGRHPKKDMKLEPLGVRSFALKVDDFEAALKEYPCGPVKTDWYGQRYCLLEDPDGQIVELHE